ncbi:unnamed protein product, partial [Discosporangium mesarthrocarpum]
MSARPIRADHALSRKKGSPHTVGGSGMLPEPEDRSKQRRVGTNAWRSPSKSRTPSPSSLPHSPAAPAVPIVPHGHGLINSTRRSPSARSPFQEAGGASWEKRRGSPDHPVRKSVHPLTHGSQRAMGSKSPGHGSALYKGQQSKGVNGVVGAGLRGSSSPTPGRHVSGIKGRSAPPMSKDGADVSDTAITSGQPLTGTMVVAMDDIGGALGVPPTSGDEAREMTPLDRVFLEQTLSHEGRPDVEDDDLHLCKKIQTHLQSRVQHQLMEATYRSSSAGATRAPKAGSTQNFNNSAEAREMELIQDDGDYHYDVACNYGTLPSPQPSGGVGLPSSGGSGGIGVGGAGCGEIVAPARVETSPTDVSDSEAPPFFPPLEEGASTREGVVGSSSASTALPAGAG